MKIVRTVLCTAVLAFAGGTLARQHFAPAPEPVDEVLAFINDPSILRELGIEPDGSLIQREVAHEAVPLVVVGDETTAEMERRLAAERWQARLEEARTINATTVAKPEHDPDFEVRMPQFAPVNTSTPPMIVKNPRGPKSIYEQSRHYQKYGAFETKVKKKNRGRVTVSLRR